MSEENEIIYDTNNSKYQTRFHQQNIKAWKPEMSMSSTFPGFLFCGAIFLGIGIFLSFFASSISEIEINYTKCNECHTKINCECSIPVILHEPIRGKVYLYYKLYNFYQNHRRFVRGRDSKQLEGRNINYDTISDKCEPYRRTIVNGTKKIYAPCGLVANSLFNDTFELKIKDDSKSIEISKTNISWDVERKKTFGIPKSFNNTIRPPGWKKPKKNLYKNEDLIVWMKIAPLPTFKKLYGILKVDSLKAGNYSMKISYNFPVHMFKGDKSFVITNTNFMGGKNAFIVYTFITVGGIQFLLACFFLLIPRFWHKSRLQSLMMDPNLEL